MPKRLAFVKNLAWKQWLLPAISIVVMVYTFDQLWNGERGLVTWRLMHNQVSDLSAKNAILKADVARLEDNTDRLKITPTHKKLDEDFLDEQIRRFLPLIKPGDTVVVW